MYKVPAKYKKQIVQELKTFVPLINSLVARGKGASEEDTRILLNDILHSVLGYNKFNELKTEMRDKSNRFDYGVKLNEGPKSKSDKLDFIIEAKASHVDLNQSVIDQTLPYCISSGVDYFFLSNAVKWQMFKVVRQGKIPTAIKIHEVSFSLNSINYDDLADDFYLFSKWSYLNSDWKQVAEVTKATKAEDVVAVLLSDKIVRAIARELSTEHEVKIQDESIHEILEKTILKSWGGEYNKRLLKKLNEKMPNKKEITSVVSLDVASNSIDKLGCESTQDLVHINQENKDVA
jgi:hypothetical protein